MAIRMKPVVSDEEYSDKLSRKSQNVQGQEIPDSTPIAPPIGFVRQPSLAEQIREMVRSEHLRQAALTAGMETFEEADDFDVPDELEPISGYENDPQFEPDLSAFSTDSSLSSTGVPPPGGGGKGGGEPSEEPQKQPAEAEEAPPAAVPAAAKKPRKAS